MTYQLAEDTILLLNSLKLELQSNILTIDSKLDICEVGCGNAEIITQLTKQFNSNLSSYATDINPQAIKDSIQLIKKENLKIDVKEGNFCDPFDNQKFDIIFFNTPYLPCEDNDRFSELSIEDKALYGGTLGCEVTNEFIDSLHKHIRINSKIYILISSLTQPHLVEENLRENGFQFEIISKEKHFFEELLVYKITLSNVLQHLVKHNYLEISKFNKGKHSYILQAKKNTKVVMIKYGKEQHISKEIFYLNKLQKTNYAPKIVEFQDNFVIYNKIEGVAIENFFQKLNSNSSYEIIENIINECFKICFDLDIKGICKDEMTRPHHHIFVDNENDYRIGFIDFERSTHSLRFQNSRQFMQYLIKYNYKFKELDFQISQKKIIEIGKNLDKLNPIILLNIIE